MTPRKRKTAPLTVLQRQQRIWAKLNAAAVRDGVQIVDKHTGEMRQATKGEAIGLWRDNVYKLVKVESEGENARDEKLAALRAELQAVKAERDELFSVTVKAFDAMFEIGVGIAPEELTPRVRALDHALANDLNDELWERINSAALAKGAK